MCKTRNKNRHLPPHNVHNVPIMSQVLRTLLALDFKREIPYCPTVRGGGRGVFPACAYRDNRTLLIFIYIKLDISIT